MKLTMRQCRKGSWVSEWVVTSFQESWTPPGSSACCFSCDEEFSSTKKTKKLKLAKQCGRQARKKLKHNALRYSWNDVIRDQSFFTRSTLLGVAIEGNLKLDGKKHRNSLILGLKTFWDDMEIPKPKKTFWPFDQHWLSVEDCSR